MQNCPKAAPRPRAPLIKSVKGEIGKNKWRQTTQIVVKAEHSAKYHYILCVRSEKIICRKELSAWNGGTDWMQGAWGEVRGVFFQGAIEELKKLFLMIEEKMKNERDD